MKIVIDLSKYDIKKLSEITEVKIDPEDPDGLDVSDAITILLTII